MENHIHNIDDEFIADFIAGKASAFEKTLKLYKELVLNIAYRFLQDRTEAEDVAQEVFLRVYRSAKTYKPRAKFSTWLYKITANVCLNRLREKKRFTNDFQKGGPDLCGEYASPLNSPVNPASHPSEEFEKKEMQKIVKAALQVLPPNQRLAVIFKKFQGLSYQEIADILDCSIPAVDSLLQRAKNNLRKALSPYVHK